jgi:hypothetical protein
MTCASPAQHPQREYPGTTTIRKPLFMHRKTYSALLTKLRQIETIHKAANTRANASQNAR